jgi:hypothetical protein
LALLNDWAISVAVSSICRLISESVVQRADVIFDAREERLQHLVVEVMAVASVYLGIEEHVASL